MSSTDSLVQTAFATLSKKIKWNENKSIAGYESSFDSRTAADKFFQNPLLMLSPRCPRITEDFCLTGQRWLQQLSTARLSSSFSPSSSSSSPLSSSSSSSSVSAISHSLSASTTSSILQPVSSSPFERVVVAATTTTTTTAANLATGSQTGASAIDRYYYLQEAFTIITFSIVIYIWFWLYGYDRDQQKTGTHRKSLASSSPSSSPSATSKTKSSTTDDIVAVESVESQEYYLQSKSLIYDLELRLYHALPLRATSSLWGKINSYDLPIWMRSRLYDFFSRTYNCDMSEALDSDYRNYRNLSEFFSRRLKPSSRPISQEPGVVSPADGLVLHFGPIMDGRIEGVKGLNYSVQAFLGLPSNDYEKELLVNKEDNELYNCIIYLAPGDYHRFHSPANWLVNRRKHFPGRLLSVRPSLMKRMPEVLHINERVCYFGNWAHGFFSMTAVGATNVGSIKVNFDEDLRTNRRHLWRPDRYACFEHKFNESIQMEAGQDFGEFNFGSTIVLIFEAPKYSVLDTQDNQRIKYGQLMARIEPPAVPELVNC